MMPGVSPFWTGAVAGSSTADDQLEASLHSHSSSPVQRQRKTTTTPAASRRVRLARVAAMAALLCAIGVAALLWHREPPAVESLDSPDEHAPAATAAPALAPIGNPRVEETRPPPREDSAEPPKQDADWKVVWKDGSDAEAVAAVRAWAEATKSEDAADVALLATLRRGTPDDVARTLPDWVAAACEKVLEPSGTTGEGRWWSIWMAENYSAGSAFRWHMQGRFLHAAFVLEQYPKERPSPALVVIGHIDRALGGLPDGEDKVRLQAVRDFLWIGSHFAPSVDSTTERVLKIVRPLAAQFLATHGKSEDPSVRSMVKWLQRRFEEAPR
jgi:hypothetical protein